MAAMHAGVKELRFFLQEGGMLGLVVSGWWGRKYRPRSREVSKPPSILRVTLEGEPRRYPWWLRALLSIAVISYALSIGLWITYG